MLFRSVSQSRYSRVEQLRLSEKQTASLLTTKETELALLERQFVELVDELKKSQRDLEIHEKASIALKDLIRVVSTENITQIETLVNSAIKSVMPDKRVFFKIESVIRRDLTEYEFQVIRQGSNEPGSTESNGGGLFALIAFVLKITFNVLSKKAPLVVLDESLSFISEQYLLPTSNLINQIAEEFNLTVLLVTHQPLFGEAATSNYLSVPQENETTLKRVK